MVGVQVAWKGDPSTTRFGLLYDEQYHMCVLTENKFTPRLVPVTPEQNLLHIVHLQVNLIKVLNCIMSANLTT